MNKKFIKDIDVSGKLVFVRNDFNVPLNEKGEITDETRIISSLPTLEYLTENGAKIVCASHLGRPEGERKTALSLKPVAEKLSRLLQTKVKFNGTTVGKKISKIKSKLKKGEILLLENLRFDQGETQNDEKLARELANGIDIFVNDAFGTAHRSHASITKMTEFVPVSAAGFLLKKEIDFLSMAVENPPENYVIILGGSKVSDKISVIKNLINKASTFLIGGAMAYTFLKAKGFKVGNSKVEEDYLQECSEILKKADENNVKMLLPVDHIAATKIEPDITVKMIKRGEDIPEEMMGLDIGFETIKLYLFEIEKAELIVWNGPMGVFEINLFSAGTTEIAKAIEASSATSIIGGGDSISAVNKTCSPDQISHISTGGGATIEFLSGKKLPGIEALSEA